MARAPQNSATAARQTSARLTSLTAAGISSLGELRVLFGLLLLPAAAGGALSLTIWSWRRDLNPRPSDYKSDALPAELRQQFGTLTLHGQFNPSDPFLRYGTILKVTITAPDVQPEP